MSAVEIDPGELNPDGELITGLKPDRRHPVEVTSSRLAEHVEQYGRHITPTESDALADAVEVLDLVHARIAAAMRRRERAES